MAEDEVVEEVRPFRRGPRTVRVPYTRICTTCDFEWPSLTTYTKGDFTKCPHCGAKVPGESRRR